MVPRTEIINNKIVNFVEQLARFLKPGDIFRKVNSNTKYKFASLRLNEKIVVCENMDTHRKDQIYYNAPVFKLVYL